MSHLSPFNCQGCRTSSCLWKNVILQGGVAATLAGVALHCATMAEKRSSKMRAWTVCNRTAWGGREENGLSKRTLLDDCFPAHDAFSAPFGKRFNRSLVRTGVWRVFWIALQKNTFKTAEKRRRNPGKKGTSIFCAKLWYAPNPGSKERSDSLAHSEKILTKALEWYELLVHKPASHLDSLMEGLLASAGLGGDICSGKGLVLIFWGSDRFARMPCTRCPPTILGDSIESQSPKSSADKMPWRHLPH